MKKNIYEKPEMMVVRLQHQNILCTSDLNLHDTEVTGGWSKEANDLDFLDNEW